MQSLNTKVIIFPVTINLAINITGNMKYELNTFHRNTPDQELLDDLKRIATKLGRDEITWREYEGQGNFAPITVTTRFGGWNKALEKAGLAVTRKQNLSDVELFENIEEVWIKLGRQPLYEEIKRPFSKYSAAPYKNRFGSWRKALEVFVAFINSENEETQNVEHVEAVSETTQANKPIFKHKTKRAPSKRLQVQVLLRDGNKCRLCGITVTGENIHFDHIKPWSKGGETVLENLQVLCAEHNLAKGDLG